MGTHWSAAFDGYGQYGTWERLRFGRPIRTYRADSIADVIAVIQNAEQAAENGYWACLFLTYEAGPAFDSALARRDSQGESALPLAWAGIYDGPLGDPDPLHSSYELTEWTPRASKREHARAIRAIQHWIEVGHTYQVNYTFPLRAYFKGDAWSWYRKLAVGQQGGYCAWLDIGDQQVVSASPELFFKRVGSHILTRPMKGTSQRGRWLEEDNAYAANLAASEKDRAENVMIVDMIRSDLGRIAAPGTVSVPDIFTVERYRGVLQLTSSIEAECAPDTTFLDIMRALFPCGSITGAPKIRTSEIIRELERWPRGAYTGTIGYIRPGGDCCFNVAIRTAVIEARSGAVTYGVGGGITYDSTAKNEYAECVQKASVLRPQPDFRLLETLRLRHGRYALLEHHLERLRTSALYFGFAFDHATVIAALDHARSAASSYTHRVRLTLDSDGLVDCIASRLEHDRHRPWKLTLAAQPVDQSNPMLFHKTTDRSIYDAALATDGEVDDVILWNARGELTESSRANLVLEMPDGKRWTPPRDAGLLAGTLRHVLLSRGTIRERTLRAADLERARRVWLINSLRGWIPVEKLEM